MHLHPITFYAVFDRSSWMWQSALCHIGVHNRLLAAMGWFRDNCYCVSNRIGQNYDTRHTGLIHFICVSFGMYAAVAGLALRTQKRWAFRCVQSSFYTWRQTTQSDSIPYFLLLLFSIYYYEVRYNIAMIFFWFDLAVALHICSMMMMHLIELLLFRYKAKAA